MQLKTLFTVLILAVAPVAAIAEGCSYGKHRSAASCAEGSVWDGAAGKCIASSTS